MAFGGLVIKGGATGIRLLQFLASVLVLGIYSYFLAYLATHHEPEARYIKAIEGISGVAVIYTFFAAILTCFVGGLSFSTFLAIFLDICFIGGYIAVAYMSRDGSKSCSGIVNTPLGTGDSATGEGVNFAVSGLGNNDTTYHPDLLRACRLQKGVFAVAIILIFLFIVSMLMELALRKHHQSERRYGPSPSNNYTQGSGRFGRFGRRNRTTRDAELATAGAAGFTAEKHHHNNEVGVTGNGNPNF